MVILRMVILSGEFRESEFLNGEYEDFFRQRFFLDGDFFGQRFF